MTRWPVALTIAGSDSGAGAGIQADLKTFAAIGVYGTSAVTAVTAQNTLGVSAIHPVPAAIIAAQIDAVCGDFDVAAVKIGMLPGREAVEAVADALARWRPRFVILDPVLVASSGDALADIEVAAAMKARLFALVDCLTPNLAEAAALLGERQARDEPAMARQGRALLGLGVGNALMKGGHLDSPEAVDLLVAAEDIRRYASPRIASKNLHGTGCTLSAAIATHVALGASLDEAVADAKLYVARAIEAGRELTLGGGRGPLLHLPLRRG